MIQIAKITALLVTLLALVACDKTQTETTSAQGETLAVTEEIIASTPDHALVGSAWWVEDILAAGVIDRARTTIEFTGDGRVAGNGGCNRYTGGYELNGDGISFGPIAGTKMACLDALMDQDQRFHEALAQVVRWRIDAQTGLLHLEDSEGNTVIRASALPEGEQA